MPRTTTTTPEIDARAYELRCNGATQRTIADTLNLTPQQVAHAVTRHARRFALPDPVSRRSVREAARYATSAGLPFDPAQFAELNERVSEAVGGAIFTGRTFDIEIEFRRPSGDLSDDTIVRALTDAGVETHAEDYNHRTRPHWKLIYDGSSDKELVSPPLSGREGLRDVRTAMRVLRELNCRVTRSEGMHVHVYVGDMQPTQIASVFRYYAERQRAWDMLTPAGRRDTYYARHVTTRQAERIEAYARQGNIVPPDSRYVTCNLHSYSRYQTIEFRQHAGTLNGRKACDWIELMLAVVTGVHQGTHMTHARDLFGALDAMVANETLKAATRDRLVRKASGYGFARAAVAAEPAPERNETLQEMERETHDAHAVDGVLTVWQSCNCAGCRQAVVACAEGRCALDVLDPNGRGNATRIFASAPYSNAVMIALGETLANAYARTYAAP